MKGNDFTPGKEVDLVRNRYDTIKVNHLWCIDFTHIGFFWAFVIIDAATKRIITYQIKEGNNKNKCTFNAKECIFILNNAFLQEGTPDILHSDHGGQFKTNIFKQFVLKNGIQQSFVDKKIYKFGNQLIERFFRTIKGMLLKSYPAVFKSKDQEAVQTMLLQAMQLYNNNVHSSLIGLTPYAMETALTLYTNQDKTVPLKAHLSEDTLQNAHQRATAVQTFSGDWLRFFIALNHLKVQEIKQEIRAQSDNVIQELRHQTAILIQQQQIMNEEHQEQLNNIKKMLNKMEQRALDAEALLKDKEQQKIRRLQRARQPSRDVAALAELRAAIDFILKQVVAALFLGISQS